MIHLIPLLQILEKKLNHTIQVHAFKSLHSLDGHIINLSISSLKTHIIFLKKSISIKTMHHPKADMSLQCSGTDLLKSIHTSSPLTNYLSLQGNLNHLNQLLLFSEEFKMAMGIELSTYLGDDLFYLLNNLCNTKKTSIEYSKTLTKKHLKTKFMTHEDHFTLLKKIRNLNQRLDILV